MCYDINGDRMKAFTLVELISVVIVLGIISLISIPVVANYIKDSNNLLDQNKINQIEEAASIYSIDNDLGTDTNEKTLNIRTLIDAGLLKESDVTVDNNIIGCVKYKWLENKNDYEFKYQKSC